MDENNNPTGMYSNHDTAKEIFSWKEKGTHRLITSTVDHTTPEEMNK